jgi:hypothetical protein
MLIKSRFSGWLPDGTRTPFMGGGGGGGAPSSTTSTGTTYQTNIPEYAQPYVETMLGATQKQLFEMGGGTPETTTQIGTDADGNPIMQTTPATGQQITGFKPYKPYSTNLDDYVAGFSPLQQQAMQATGQLSMPNEYGQATQMTGMAGLGSLGLAGQMAGAGQDFSQQAQDPRAMQGFMSPYMQNVVDYQKSQAARDYNIGQGVRKAQAVGQGAFGGSRQAIMEAEAQRSLGNQLQGIAATGSQKAFEDAQRQQQFGAQLGMQGRQAAMQGLGQYGAMGAQLGDLGGKQLAAQQGIIQSQYGMGQQQQAMEQQKINQAMQDWANTQQYPLMQLGVMSNMLRGLPMQASTTNQYQAAPNALTQGIGAAGAGASLYNALKGASGGLPKEFKSTTGIKSYYEGDVVESTKSDLYDLSLEELDKRAKSSTSPTIKRLATAIAKEKRMGLAGGGIIAFANPNEENNQSLVREVPEVDEGKKLLKDYLDTNPRTPPNVPPKEPILPSSYSESKKDLPLVKEPGQDVKNLRDSFTNFKMPNLSSYERGIKTAKQTKPEEVTPELVELSAPTSAVPAPAGIKPEAKPETKPEAKPEGKAGIKAAAPAAAPVVPAAAPVGDKTLGNSIAAEFGLQRPAEDPQAKMSIEEIAAKKLAFLGPDVRKEERAGLMAERASAKDEARRTMSLRMAEFFADWGSRPGSAIVAGLNALKEKVPSIISDSRKEAEIRRAINKDIAGLDKADRLEKAGAWDKAAELKSKLSETGLNTYGKELTFLSARLSDKSRERVAQIGQTGKEGATNNRDLRFYETELGKLDKQYTELTAGKNSDYIVNKNIITNAKNKIEKGDASPALKARYDAAVEQNAKIDNEYKTKRAELITERDRFKGTSTAPAPTKTELPAGAIPGSKQVGTSNGVPVYEAPDGKRYTLK